MKLILLLIGFTILAGCTTTPYKELNLDTTSNFKTPEKGKSGIYVYQWKRGIIGALFDIDFSIKGLPEVSLNTGEYAFYEVEPGNYEYSGGSLDKYKPVTFEADQNYFFRAFMLFGTGFAAIIRDQEEIEDAKLYILSGRYEHHLVD